MYNLSMTDEEIRKILSERAKRKRRKARMTRLLVSLLVFVVAAGVVIWASRAAGIKAGNQKYDAELSAIVDVTEDKPLIDTAMSQLGNKGGEPFWTWFGFGTRVEWCAIFVSWCEEQCGFIKNDKAPSFAMVADGANWFKRHDQWLGDEEAPASGDLVFFDWDQDGELDHVGIVTSVVNDLLFTVEGNSSDRCRQKRYSLSDPVINGYARISE